MKNQDLETLKKLGGPFTNPRDVAKLMRSRITDEKNQRLYVEVRYARDTSLSHPKNSSLFRLKSNHKNLSSEQYANNLKMYLYNVKSDKLATLHDFTVALDEISTTLS